MPNRYSLLGKRSARKKFKKTKQFYPVFNALLCGDGGRLLQQPLASSTSLGVVRRSLIRKSPFSVHLLQLAGAQAGGWAKSGSKRGVQIFGHLNHHGFESLVRYRQAPQPNALQLAEQVVNFNRLVLLPPLQFQFGT